MSEEKKVPLNRRGLRLVLSNGRELVFASGAGWQIAQHGAVAITEYNGRFDQNDKPLSDVVCLFNVGEWKHVAWMDVDQVRQIRRLQPVEPIDLSEITDARAISEVPRAEAPLP